MPPESEDPKQNDYFGESASWISEATRYGLAAIVVAAVAVGAFAWNGRSSSNEEASEIDGAVMIDLPASASGPASDADEGPQQQAQAGMSAQPAAEQPVPQREPAEDEAREPTRPEVKPDHEPPPTREDASPQVSMPEPAPKPRKPDALPAALPVPALQAQDEKAPPGAGQPTKTDVQEGDEGRPHASKHAITLWQRGLVERLERAKRRVDREAHGEGMVKVRFAIDARGALSQEQIVQSSGSPRLDAAALSIVRQASPFPAPPSGSRQSDTLFVLPIRFR